MMIIFFKHISKWIYEVDFMNSYQVLKHFARMFPQSSLYIPTDSAWALFAI